MVITGFDDFFGGDTVIGPGFDLQEESSVPIGDIVLPHDDPFQEHRGKFEDIRKRMKEGGSSQQASFSRKRSAGSVETVYMAYAPITTKVFVPVNATDIAYGVHVSDYLIYSLALAEPEAGLLHQFKEAEDEIQKQVAIAIVVLSFVIGLATVFIFYISNRITLSMIEPMIYLLEMIRHINL